MRAHTRAGKAGRGEGVPVLLQGHGAIRQDPRMTRACMRKRARQHAQLQLRAVAAACTWGRVCTLLAPMRFVLAQCCFAPPRPPHTQSLHTRSVRPWASCASDDPALVLLDATRRSDRCSSGGAPVVRTCLPSPPTSTSFSCAPPSSSTTSICNGTPLPRPRPRLLFPTPQQLHRQPMLCIPSHPVLHTANSSASMSSSSF